MADRSIEFEMILFHSSMETVFGFAPRDREPRPFPWRLTVTGQRLRCWNCGNTEFGPVKYRYDLMSSIGFRWGCLSCGTPHRVTMGFAQQD